MDFGNVLVVFGLIKLLFVGSLVDFFEFSEDFLVEDFLVNLILNQNLTLVILVFFLFKNEFYLL